MLQNFQLSKSPDKLGVRATLDQRWIHACEHVVGLQMAVSEQILAHYAEFQPFPELAAELSIEPRIGRYLLCRQAFDKIAAHIPGKAAGQNQVGAELGLVAWAGAFGVGYGGCVL